MNYTLKLALWKSIPRNDTHRWWNLSISEKESVFQNALNLWRIVRLLYMAFACHETCTVEVSLSQHINLSRYDNHDLIPICFATNVFHDKKSDGWHRNVKQVFCPALRELSESVNLPSLMVCLHLSGHKSQWMELPELWQIHSTSIYGGWH